MFHRVCISRFHLSEGLYSFIDFHISEVTFRLLDYILQIKIPTTGQGSLCSWNLKTEIQQ